jgi:hypothetical protein
MITATPKDTTYIDVLGIEKSINQYHIKHIALANTNSVTYINFTSQIEEMERLDKRIEERFEELNGKKYNPATATEKERELLFEISIQFFNL